MRSGWIRDLRTHATRVSHQHICSLKLIWTQLMKESLKHAGWYLHLPQPDLPELDMWTDCTQLHTDIRVIRKEEELRFNGLLCYNHITISTNRSGFSSSVHLRSELLTWSPSPRPRLVSGAPASFRMTFGFLFFTASEDITETIRMIINRMTSPDSNVQCDRTLISCLYGFVSLYFKSLQSPPNRKLSLLG